MTVAHQDSQGSRVTSAIAPSRIVGIDIARSLAILFAMTSHIWATSQMGQFFHGAYVDGARLLMALATPTFIVLFGTMLEIVYIPRFRPPKRLEITARLWTRAIQCWLLYAISVFILFLTHDGYTAMFSISTVLMLGVTPFTDILKFYTMALAVAPLLLLLRNRYGLAPLICLAVAVHLLYPVLRDIPGPAEAGLPTEVNRLAMFLLGIGSAKLGGPSVLHGLSLVVFGMTLGRLLRQPGASASQMPSAIVRRAWFIFAVAFSVLATVLWIGGQDMIRSLGDMEMRMHSHPLYFLTGVCGAYALTAICIISTTPTDRISPWQDRLSFFGRTSLFTFSFGNMLLYCIYQGRSTEQNALTTALLLLIAVVLMSVYFDWECRKDDSAIHRITTSIQRGIKLFVIGAIAHGRSAFPGLQ